MGNAEATRGRILTAATEEFARYGLAGARVERIAAAAMTNKAQLYHYYGSKEALFDASFWAHVHGNTSTMPLDATDLPAWVVSIHDDYLRDPTLLRLATWARLEREPVGDLFARRGGIHRWTIDRIVAAQQAGILIDTVDPLDLFCMVIAIAGTWAQASVTVAGATTDPENERRRTALAETVRRGFCR